MKEKIRPIYSELQGYLLQVPKKSFTRESSLWNQHNYVIEELNKVSGEDYNRFKVNPRMIGDSIGMEIEGYKNKLGGLIARLHGKYFSGEPAPFGGMPTQVISQVQQQSQNFQVQMLLEIQSKIDKEISKFKKGSDERNFLEKVRSSLSSVKNITELITLLVRTAKGIGLTIDQILNIFK